MSKPQEENSQTTPGPASVDASESAMSDFSIAAQLARFKVAVAAFAVWLAFLGYLAWLSWSGQ